MVKPTEHFGRDLWEWSLHSAAGGEAVARSGENGERGLFATPIECFADALRYIAGERQQ